MFSLEIETLARLLIDEARERRLRVVTAESCTGGLVGGALVGVAGSSDVYERGFITYSNRAKEELLGVPGDLIADAGAVSEPVARMMAEGALAAANVLSRSKNLVSRVGFIRFVNTSPSVACVGLSEDDCLRAHKRYEKSFVPISSIAISSVDNAKFGFLKLIVDISDSKRPLLGASIVCPNAELLASELALAVRHRLPVVELASSPVLSNSYSELLRLASRALIK